MPSTGVRAADRSITLKFAGAQSRYVKLQWDLSKGGSVRKLDIFGQRSDRDYKFSESTPGSTVNVSGGVGGSRVIYIHPSPVHGDEVGTKYGHFEFPESPEKFRTVIYDLGAERTLTEVGSVHSPRPVRFMAYAFEHELPETTDWRGRRSFDPAVFDSMKPVASLDDTRGVGYVRAKLTQSVKARYVALRWEPDYNPPAFVVGHTSIVVQGSNNPADQNGGGGGGGGGGEDGNSGNNNNNNPNTADNPNNFFNTPFANPFSIGTAGYAGQPGLPSGGPVAGDISQ